MFRYRDHRGSLIASMATVQEFDCKDALVEYLQEDLDRFHCGKYDCSAIKVENYGFDERIDWDTWIVSLDGYGVLGFTNGPVDGPQKAGLTMRNITQDSRWGPAYRNAKTWAQRVDVMRNAQNEYNRQTGQPYDPSLS